MNIYLIIRHGPSLLLRDITLKVSKKHIPCPILGEPVLQFIGCRNKKHVIGCCDSNGGDIDVGKALKMKGIRKVGSDRSQHFRVNQCYIT